MLVLTLESTPGDTIEVVAKQMCEIATRLQIPTQVTYNGVELMASVGYEPSMIINEYNCEIEPDGHQDLYEDPWS